MRIIIGSKNKAKVEALREIIEDYPHLKDAEVLAVETGSGVSDQPKSLDETVRGATNRAKKIFRDCNFSFGIESGLMHVPMTKTGLMDICVCAIYDGQEFYLGLSSAWETPKEVAKYMTEGGMNMNDAAFAAGYTQNPNVGAAEGLIGVITKGRLTRKDYTKEAIRTALIHLEDK